MQVDDPVGLDASAAEAPVPAAVEGIPPRNGEGDRPRSGRWRGPTVDLADTWAPSTILRLRLWTVPLPVRGRIGAITR
jgi:hypothetical protein